MLPYIKRVHLIGICGIGVSALAKWFKANGWRVSGSDAQLRGHSASFLPKDTRLVVYSNAITQKNPELLKAKSLKIKTVSYPEALGELTKTYRAIAVAGSHGKSTTTALTSLILIKAGFDPTVIIGTKLKEFGGSNFRHGKGDFLVVEADEWKGAFWRYSPTFAIITNIDKEHLDFYKNFSNVKKSFLKFIKSIRYGGFLVINKNDTTLYSLRNAINKIAEKNELKILWSETKQQNVKKIKRVLQLPGKHNLSNALSAFTLAKATGIKEKIILGAIKKYKGAWRRMDYKGRFKIKDLRFKIDVYDDYAHHPTEIKATLAAFREKFRSASRRTNIVCVFQPHQADRLKRLFKDFQTAFTGADHLILLPVYKVAGRDNLDKRYTSGTLAKKIPGAIYLENPEKIRETVQKIIQSQQSHDSHYVIVMMGAGNIVKYTKLLIR